MQNTYKDAIKLLRSRTRLARSTTRPDEPRLNVPNNYNMVEWLAQLGHTNLSALNVVHITGTKGKGSTAALTASILQQHLTRTSPDHRRPVKIGLYTSPHVVTERDRIRINLAPVSEADFSAAFFHVWRTLRCDEADAAAGDYAPGYLQLLALVSVHLFAQAGVDMAVYEVHAGGRKDATNIFARPLACGFARIGLDHAALLGPGVDTIAWHKSGIMKAGRPAFSVAQDDVPAAVLRAQAAEIGAPLVAQVEDVVGPDLLPPPSHPNVGQPAQRENASLAIALARAALAALAERGGGGGGVEEEEGEELSRADIELGIARCAWPGRFQHLFRDGVHWMLDAAHNELSLPVAASWFKAQSVALEKGPSSSQQPPCRRILIFGHSSDRSTERLVDVLLQSCSEHDLAFDQVILSSYHRYDIPIPESVAKEQLQFWQSRHPQTPIQHAVTADAAIDTVRHLQDSLPTTSCQVFITGSAHLVGQSLCAIGGEELVLAIE